MEIQINNVEFGWMLDDFEKNKTTVALNCKFPCAVVFRKVYITKPSRIYMSIGSANARMKWFRKILFKYYTRQVLTKQLKAVSRLKKLNK